MARVIGTPPQVESAKHMILSLMQTWPHGFAESWQTFAEQQAQEQAVVGEGDD